jgi:hypothetical protein
MPMSPRLLRPRASSFDPAAQAYFNAVALADGQQLEAGVKKAINDFIVGCKLDNIWSAIKTSCILMGARTLSGALTPLVGSTPTNINFVSGDYNRKTGLVGDGSTKYLNTNRNTNLDGQDDCHIALYASTANTGLRWYAGAGVADTGTFNMLSNSSEFQARCRNSSADSQLSVAVAGLLGASRNNSADFIMRGNGTNHTKTRASQSPFNGNYFVYLSNGSTSFYSNARVAFYSMGGSLNLASLDARVSALYTAIGAAI